MKYSNKEIVLNFIFDDLSNNYVIDIETGRVFIKKGDNYKELSKTGNRCTLVKNDKKQIRLSELKIAKITDTYIDLYNGLLKDTPSLSNKDLGILVGIYIKNAIENKSL